MPETVHTDVLKMQEMLRKLMNAIMWYKGNFS